jgi:hypothetical protein
MRLRGSLIKPVVRSKNYALYPIPGPGVLYATYLQNGFDQDGKNARPAAHRLFASRSLQIFVWARKRARRRWATLCSRCKWTVSSVRTPASFRSNPPKKPIDPDIRIDIEFILTQTPFYVVVDHFRQAAEFLLNGFGLSLRMSRA